MIVMPYSSLRPCTYPGCNVLVKAGRCAAHSTKKVERDPEVRRLYNTPQWRSLRAAHLAKYPWCVDCLNDHVHTFATDVDHIKRHDGDQVLFFDETNLQSLCKSHHSSKTAREVWHSDV
jgi:5-methylcytosine-specific restriction protein A